MFPGQLPDAVMVGWRQGDIFWNDFLWIHRPHTIHGSRAGEHKALQVWQAFPLHRKVAMVPPVLISIPCNMVPREQSGL